VAKAATPPPRHGSIFVLAGCNGAGKTSIGGAALLESGVRFYNPDEAARTILAANAHLNPRPTMGEVNAAAWSQGRTLLERAIDQHLDFAFETTLGGQTMSELLERAAAKRLAVHVWFAGLHNVELHIERVRQRVMRGGHDIPRVKIVERYDSGRKNLVRLLPQLASVRVYDNSAEADPGQPATLSFIADKTGSFRFRCNVTCGAMHPFMIGKLTVGTNHWLYRGIGLAILAALGVLMWTKRKA